MNDRAEMESHGRARRPSRTRIVILGARRHSRRLARSLGQGPWGGLPLVGFVDLGHSGPSGLLGRNRQLAVHPQSEPVPVLGGVDRLAELVDRAGATDLVVALNGSTTERLRARLEDLTGADVRVHWVGGGPEVPETFTVPADWAQLRAVRPLHWGRIGKRLVDLIGAAVGLVLLSPLFALITLVILLTSGRPVFYTQERVGQGGRIFQIIKFRSMKRDAEGQTGPIWASEHDDRCTPVGAWLRRTNIDELPQLWNVLTGEMSLVGPRPERPVFVEHFRLALTEYDLRHAVPVGMTGWAQVHGWRGRTSLRKRLQFDLDYIQRWSFWLDIRILFMTVQHVFGGKTSWKPKSDA